MRHSKNLNVLRILMVMNVSGILLKISASKLPVQINQQILTINVHHFQIAWIALAINAFQKVVKISYTKRIKNVKLPQI